MTSCISITEINPTNGPFEQTTGATFTKKRQLVRGLELSKNLTMESRKHPYKNAKVSTVAAKASTYLLKPDLAFSHTQKFALI